MATNLSLAESQTGTGNNSYNDIATASPSPDAVRTHDDPISSVEIPIDAPSPLSTSKSELSARAQTYRGQNPWEGRKLTWWDYFKLGFFTLTGIVLVKFVIFLIAAFFCWLFARLTVTGLSNEDLRRPLPCWRRACRHGVQLMVRVWLILFGFYYIRIKRRSRVISSKSSAVFDASKPSSKGTNVHAPLPEKMASESALDAINTQNSLSALRKDASNSANDGNDGSDGQDRKPPMAPVDEDGDAPVMNDALRAHCIVANHHTAFDGFILFCAYGAAAVAKMELGSIPIAGYITRATQAILVDRVSRAGRKKAVQDIEDHMKNYNLPPLVLFPQATCSNIDAITTFKVGAFIPGLPLKPVALNFHGNKFTNLSFVGDSIGWEIYYSMCQFINFVTIEECEEYFPSRNEMADARLFAENVRREVVKKLPHKVGMTQHSYDDFVLVRKIGKATRHRKRMTPQINDLTQHIVIEDVSRLLQLKVRTMTKLADRFSHYDLNSNGSLSYEEFCLAFGRPPEATNMKKLFRVFNTKRRHLKSIEFEEFLAGISICFVNEYIEDALRVMFDACNYSNESMSDDEDDIANEYITYQWLMDTIEKNFGPEAEDAQVIENVEKTEQNETDENGQKVGSKEKMIEKKKDEKEEEKEKTNDAEVRPKRKSQAEEIALAKSKADKARKTVMAKLEPMVKDVFESKDEQLKFDTFVDRMMPHYAETCQIFLQTFICRKLGIQLTSADFVEPSKVNFAWDWTRGSSIRTISYRNSNKSHTSRSNSNRNNTDRNKNNNDNPIR